MFLKHRVLQAEYFDSLGRPAAEIAEGYAMLGRVNRLFAFARPFTRFLPQALGPESCRSLSILDLGAGDGSLGSELTQWAASRGWDWRFTNLDINLHALRLNPTANSVAASALALPFRDRAFDCVIASQMTHHLMLDDEACRHFREAWRVTKRVLLLNDLHRNPVLYAIIWLLLKMYGFPRQFCNDGLLSVQRSWRAREWRALAAAAGIPDARVWLYGGARLMLEARRDAADLSPITNSSHSSGLFFQNQRL
jgi:2-polyprenyl-3-methyl-5-hydroxy-6-metoxy-1,4-benzoquinol methylase